MIKYLNRHLSLNRILIFIGIIAFIFILIFIFWWNKEIEVGGNHEESKPKSSIAGLECDNYSQRPLAVMLASDPEARPLSGISRADMVFEMPVTPNGVTRLMAVFQCEKPEEIGSVRSAREDFIPLVAGLKAIYAHWGGERGALEKLKNHIMDNVDAMKYEGTVFYRKKGVPAPHNGFTNWDLLFQKSEDLGYDLNDIFVGYSHQEKIPSKNLSNLASEITINYPSPDNMNWIYDGSVNSYARKRGGLPEIDKNSNEQVKASVVIVMKTTSKFLSKDYISVDVQSGGLAEIYQNGLMINGRWTKDSSGLDSKLYFYDNNGKEIEFAPGKIWVEIVTQ